MEDGPDILNIINLITLLKISGFLVTAIVGIPLFILLAFLIIIKVGIQTIIEDFLS